MNRFTCDCGKSMQMPGNFLGKRVQCRQCGMAFTVASAQTEIGEVRDVPRLTITLAPNRLEERIMLTGQLPITFGKARSADVQIDHPTVSRTHGKLSPYPHGWTIEDAGSTNGIIVNGTSVQSHQLTSGDIVRIGDIELTFGDPNAIPAAPVAAAPVAPPVTSGGGGGVPLVDLDEFDDDDDDEGYQIALDPDALEPENLEPTNLEPVARASPSSARGVAASIAPPPRRERCEGDVQCDGCDTYLPGASAVCTRCGTKLKSGRPLIMSVGLDVEELYDRAHTVISPLSWFPALWLGIFPFASDAGGSRKPIAIWVIATLTCLVSMWYFTVDETPAMQHHKNLMLWPTNPGEPDAARLQFLYMVTNHGDSKAFEAKLEELTAESEAIKIAENGGVKPAEPEVIDSIEDFEDFEDVDFESLFAPENPELVIAAHQALEPHQRATGEFRSYQLLTHALLHGGWMHLAGNMLFMFVFGTRVNALVGNAATAVIYPILAIFAAIAHMISTAGEPATAMLGASGAIMGLAGMYFVLFPVQHVHMAIWLRLLPLLLLKMFAVRGFWVIAFYIGQDIFFSSIGVETGTAHWAHLGGFIAGMVIGLMLLLARIVAVQGDLLSVTFGRAAWGLVGRPGDRQRRPTLSWGVFGSAGPRD